MHYPISIRCKDIDILKNVITHQTNNLVFFYVQSKTSIALVCDEKEIGKVDPMNCDSSFYVSTKCTPDPWTM